MNKKIINKRHSMWYNKRHPYNLFVDLSNYIKVALRSHILWIEKYIKEDELQEVLKNFNKAMGSQDKNKQDLLDVLKKMYFSFEEASLDFSNSPWHIWWKNENYKDCLVPDNVKEAEKNYRSDINIGIMLYANLIEFISSTWVRYAYVITDKARICQLERIDKNLNRVYAFDDDQAWYIYEGLLSFKKAKRYGVPCDLTRDIWEKYLDNMIFTFHEMLFCHENASKYSEEEYKQKYNGGKELFGNCFLSLWDIR